MKKRLIGLVIGVGMALSASATTYYVSKTGADDATHTGRSWELAKKTIQAAVDLCAADDTVMVDDGEYSDTTDVTIESTAVPTVVTISKKIKLVSRNGKEKTHIVGAWAPTANGLGVGAHRGIYNTADGTLIQGFTIRDCATVGTRPGVNNRLDNGGAISCGSGSCIVVDCTIDNCRAGQGGASDSRVDFFRCLITRCQATGKIQVFYRGTYAANCIIVCCGKDSAGTIAPDVQTMTMANCTFILNNCCISRMNNANSRHYLYNCAVLDNLCSSNGGDYLATMMPEYCVDSRTDGGIHEAGAAAHCQSGVDIYQYFSPASGDWRLISGNALKDKGSDAYVDLSWIPAAYRTDYFGRPRKVGTVDIGAIEQQLDEEEVVPTTAAFRPTTGVTLTAGDVVMTGSDGSYWYRLENFAGQIRVAPTQGTEVFGYTVTHSGSPSYTSYRFPDCGTDGGFWYMPSRTGTTSFVVTRAQDEKWADANYTGGDSDGSEEKPFTTIQEAFNATKTNGVVHVKPGVYATGVNSATGFDEEANPDGATCRVSLWKNVAVRSTDGAAATVIRGGEDVSTIVRISRRTRVTQLQGFTLTGQTGSGDGAFYGRYLDSSWAHVTDCVISNNVSQQAALYGGWAERCLLRDNFTTQANMDRKTGGNRGTQAYGSVLSACVIDYSPEYLSSGNYPVACTSAAQNDYQLECTFRIPAKDAAGNTYRTFNTANGSTVAFNNASVGGQFDALGAGPVAGGNVMSPGSSFGTWMTGYAKGDYFVDSEAADYRPLAAAPGLDAGTPTPDAYRQYEVGDFNGQPLAIRANGAPMPGAFQVPARLMMTVASSRGGIVPSGIFNLGPGEKMTFSVVPDGVHAFQGWVVDGVTNLTTETSWEYTMTADVEAPSLQPLFTSEIYIGAVNGDDAHDGMTSATAKRTLASVAGAVSGDVIHAAEGDYNDRQVDLNANYTVKINTWNKQVPLPYCRGVIGAGVTLLASGAKEKTFITGACDANGEWWNGSLYTRAGTNAVRCLVALAGARVEGFTIRNGATRGISGGPTDVNGGGCVLAPSWDATRGDSSTATFVNCDFSDGVARSGGDVFGGVYYKCRFTGGASFSGAGGCASWGARHVQCLIDRGTQNDSAVVNHRGLINCTIYNTGMSGSYDLLGDGGNSPSYPILNCVICTAGSKEDYTLKHVKNCIIRRMNGEKRPAFDPETCENLTFVNNWREIGVDNTTGAIMTDSLAIDRGVTADLLANSAENCATDYLGGQRVYNGTIDAGCSEFDWRPVFAACLTPKKLVVDAADPSVTTNAAGALVIPSGAVSATWTAAVASAKLPIEVTGTGTLSIYLNEALVQTVTAAEGPQTLKLSLAKTGVNAFLFVYEPGASDNGAALLGALDYSTGCMFIIR